MLHVPTCEKSTIHHEVSSGKMVERSSTIYGRLCTVLDNCELIIVCVYSEGHLDDWRVIYEDNKPGGLQGSGTQEMSFSRVVLRY
jgi:hypothetical protein